MELPAAFCERMRRDLGEADFARYLAAMGESPRRSARVNSLKLSLPELCALKPGAIPAGDGEAFFLTESDSPGRDILHAAGLYYVQESSARYPVSLFTLKPGMAVLDLCAAPGGKSGQLAAALKGEGLLVANEYVSSRAAVLEGNLERLGVTNAVVTNADAETLCTLTGPVFDCVLVDAPCAGEGMFRKDAEAVRAWSPEHVTSCAHRQHKLLLSAAGAVKPGGQLVYSTCSFSPEENGGNVRLFLEARTDFTLVSEKTLYPHTSSGEGQYAALLVRDGVREETPLLTDRGDRCPALSAFSAAMEPLPRGTVRLLKDGRALLVPPLFAGAQEGLLKRTRIVRAGLLLGEEKKGRFEPSHALALAGRSGFLRERVSVSGGEAVRFMAGETLARPAAGWCTVCFGGYPIGLGKGADGIVKNHLPKGLRGSFDIPAV